MLKKALELNLSVIVCINKIDRPEARPDEVIDEVLELLMDLDASDEQLDCPFLYASAKLGHAVLDLNDTPKDMTPLFETILKYIPAPTGDPGSWHTASDQYHRLQRNTLDVSGVGKVENGNDPREPGRMLVNHHDLTKKKKSKGQQTV